MCIINSEHWRAITLQKHENYTHTAVAFNDRPSKWSSRRLNKAWMNEWKCKRRMKGKKGKERKGRRTNNVDRWFIGLWLQFLASTTWKKILWHFNYFKNLSSLEWKIVSISWNASNQFPSESKSLSITFHYTTRCTDFYLHFQLNGKRMNAKKYPINFLLCFSCACSCNIQRQWDEIRRFILSFIHLLSWVELIKNDK